MGWECRLIGLALDWCRRMVGGIGEVFVGAAALREAPRPVTNSSHASGGSPASLRALVSGPVLAP